MATSTGDINGYKEFIAGLVLRSSAHSKYKIKYFKSTCAVGSISPSIKILFYFLNGIKEIDSNLIYIISILYYSIPVNIIINDRSFKSTI